MRQPPKILVADDHGIFIAGLRLILEPGCEVVESVSDGRALVEAALRLSPDLVIADISMPGLNGIDALRQIRRQGSKVKVLFLTMHPDVTYASEAIEAGACGYVLKHAVTSELVLAVEKVLGGDRYVSPPLAEKLEGTLARLGEGRKRKVKQDLTGRQREVLQLVAEGHSAKEIAEILFISPRTVDFHKQELRKQLGVTTTAELVQHAIRLRLLSSEEE